MPLPNGVGKLTTEIEMMPHLISYGGPELFVGFVMVVVTPVLWGIVLRHFSIKVNLVAIGVLWTGAVIAAYWDVYQISKEAERLCREETGLHVYKTVEADGFLGAMSIDYWSKYGFRYLEMEFVGGRKVRYTLKDGEPSKEQVEQLWSQYEYVTDSEVLEMPIVRHRKMIKDRQTGEVLGEIVAYLIYPGWIDSRIIGLLGFTWSPPLCDGNHKPTDKTSLSYTVLVKAVINARDFN